MTRQHGMLTVDYDRLGLQEGELVLDMGAGAGRHAFESLPPGRAGRRARLLLRRAAAASATCSGPWARPARSPRRARGACVRRRRPPAALRRRHLRPHHLLGGARAHPRRHRRHGRADPGAASPAATIAVTVPAWLPEKICWWLSAEYHAPLAEGGHVRIYTEAAAPCTGCRPPGSSPGLAPGPRPALPVLVAASAWSARPTTRTPWCRRTTSCWCGTSPRRPLVTRFTERLLNPVLGKSVVVYSRKPGRHGAPTAAETPAGGRPCPSWLPPTTSTAS